LCNLRTSGPQTRHTASLGKGDAAIRGSRSSHVRRKLSSYRAARDAPPLARRHYRRWFIISMLMFVIINSAVVPFIIYKVALRWSFVFFGLWGLSVIILIYLALRSHKRLVKRLESSGFKLCPSCGYPLTGLTGKTCCPECGLELDVEQVESAWRRYRSIRTGPFV